MQKPWKVVVFSWFVNKIFFYYLIKKWVDGPSGAIATGEIGFCTFYHYIPYVINIVA